MTKTKYNKDKMKKGMNKRAQVTIFIIIAVVVVGLVALFYAFYPSIKGVFVGELKTPETFIRTCIEEDMNRVINELSLQGGVLEPEFYYEYKLDKLRYLCYTNEYYKLCTVQEPMLKETIEREIQREISGIASACFDEMVKVYRGQGYTVTLNKGNEKVEVLPQKVEMTFEHTLVLRKDDAQTYDSFRIIFNNKLYESVMIAISIIGFETVLGDAETTIYMDNYRDMKVEKLKESDGTTLYIITDRDSGNKFQFASRSMAWKPGFSWENTI